MMGKFRTVFMVFLLPLVLVVGVAAPAYATPNTDTGAMSVQAAPDTDSDNTSRPADAGPTATMPREYYLPVVRWSGLPGKYHSMSNAAVWDIMAAVKGGVASVGLSIAAVSDSLWAWAVNIIVLASEMDLYQQIGVTLDKVRAALGTALTGSGAAALIGMLGLALLLSAIWKWYRTGQGQVFIRELLPKIGCLAVVSVMLTAPVSTAATPAPGSGSWLVQGVDKVIRNLGTALPSAAQSAMQAASDNIQQDGRKGYCRAYVDSLYNQYTASSTAAAKNSSGTVGAGVTDASQIAKSLSHLWEFTAVSMWRSQQFGTGNSLLGAKTVDDEDAWCFLAESLSNMPRQVQRETFRKAGLEATSGFYLSGPLSGSAAFTTAANDTDEVDAAIVFWTACREEGKGKGKSGEVSYLARGSKGGSLGPVCGKFWRVEDKAGNKKAKNNGADKSVYQELLVSNGDGATKEQAEALFCSAREANTTSIPNYCDQPWADFVKANNSTTMREKLPSVRPKGFTKACKAFRDADKLPVTLAEQYKIYADANGWSSPTVDQVSSTVTLENSFYEKNNGGYPFLWNDQKVIDKDLGSHPALQFYIENLHGKTALSNSTTRGVIYGISSVAIFAVYALMGLVLLGAKLMLVVTGVFFGFLLIGASLPGVNVADKVKKMFISVLGYSAVSVVLTMVASLVTLIAMVLTNIGAAVLESGSVGWLLWVGASPLVAVFGASRLFKKLGVPSPMSLKGALAWGTSGASMVQGAVNGLKSGVGGGFPGPSMPGNKGANLLSRAAGKTAGSMFGGKHGETDTTGAGAKANMPARNRDTKTGSNNRVKSRIPAGLIGGKLSLSAWGRQRVASLESRAANGDKRSAAILAGQKARKRWMSEHGRVPKHADPLISQRIHNQIGSRMAGLKERVKTDPGSFARKTGKVALLAAATPVAPVLVGAYGVGKLGAAAARSRARRRANTAEEWAPPEPAPKSLPVEQEPPTNKPQP